MVQADTRRADSKDEFRLKTPGQQQSRERRLRRKKRIDHLRPFLLKNAPQPRERHDSLPTARFTDRKQARATFAEQRLECSPAVEHGNSYVVAAPRQPSSQ